MHVSDKANNKAGDFRDAWPKHMPHTPYAQHRSAVTAASRPFELSEKEF
jgi:hypothetical protein